MPLFVPRGSGAFGIPVGGGGGNGPSTSPAGFDPVMCRLIGVVRVQGKQRRWFTGRRRSVMNPVVSRLAGPVIPGRVLAGLHAEATGDGPLVEALVRLDQEGHGVLSHSPGGRVDGRGGLEERVTSLPRWR